MKCREKNKVNHNNAEHLNFEHLLLNEVCANLQLTMVSKVILPLPKYCYTGVKKIVCCIELIY